MDIEVKNQIMSYPLTNSSLFDMKKSMLYVLCVMAGWIECYALFFFENIND